MRCLQADTGTKMVHVGKNTRSRIVSKGISAGHSRNCYRGLVQIAPSAKGARNYSQCDSMLIGDGAGANTYPYIQVRRAATGGSMACKGFDGKSMTLASQMNIRTFISHQLSVAGDFKRLQTAVTAQ